MGKGAGDRLLELTQGKKTAAEYAPAFRTIAAQTTGVSDLFKTLFRRGLSPELQTELACRDEGKSLDQFIELAIHVDNLIRSRRNPPRTTIRTASMSAARETESMQINHLHLSTEERICRITQRLCLYCVQPGHFRLACPSRPNSERQRLVSVNIHALNSDMCVTVPITLNVNGLLMHY